ncbi:MAG: trimeric intracellular cation channel family protein [Prevotella sp.]|nr:trimeric intracellular cation channel family protein [Prevotella sp.]MCI6308583.1 trimeric intracellular cation channel family protein [Prevotella sp.]MCI6766131.1 trimeric intracellular cation channel family protein [Prevotella sp.]MCI7250694.1 trimeric intracellular cation channel family protein [Prevotella sp.]MCI7283802.1 trimeric intracellular cation channel family protein [Prevotella sp.]
MNLEFDELYSTVMKIIEVLGTFTFVVSGIRQASAKHFDWFGGFVCGIAVAIGGGTVRDVMLGVTPFWMTSSLYMSCAVLALLFTVVFSRSLKKLDNAWFVFDTLGLGLFTVAGIQKTLECGHPFWVAIIMGCITGSAGGVMRDVFLNNIPVIFQKEIYATACVAGGFIYWGLALLNLSVTWMAAITFVVVCSIRFLAVKYHITFPTLKDEI